VLWHGAGQFSKTWETTADGRESFQTLFLRRHFGVYVLDQPRRGNASRSTVTTTVTATPDEQLWFNLFRIGTWPKCFPGVQFSCTEETLNQYFRSMASSTGPFDAALFSTTVGQLFDKIGPAILVTHSQSGGPGWLTLIKRDLLQTPGLVVMGGRALPVQAATANRLATKAAWAFMSRPPTLCTCPFLTIAIAS
jgi:hypothetical protein